jgi:hypothetical protein
VDEVVLGMDRSFEWWCRRFCMEGEEGWMLGYGFVLRWRMGVPKRSVLVCWSLELKFTEQVTEGDSLRRQQSI